MLFPAFGKNGYLIHSGIEVPIYMWNYNYTMERTSYITSNSNNLPVKNNGVVNSKLTISGVQYVPSMITSFLSSNDFQSFEIGWMNFLDSTRNYIDSTGMVDLIELTFNYGKAGESSFIWSITYSGCRYLNELQERALDFMDDNLVCSTHPCEIGSILTSDVSMGAIVNVDKVTIRLISNRSDYLTSEFPNIIKNSPGTLDKQISLSTHGNFDYWLDLISSNIAYTYRFFYTPLLSWDISNMKASSMNNLSVDVSTNAIISANIELNSGI